MTTRLFLALLTLLATGLTPALAANDDDAQAEIGNALLQWTDDFNAHRADKICDLFERGLIADIRTAPPQDYETICERLKHSVTDPSRSYQYAPPDIKEILVFGDVAVVRLIWTLTISGSAVGDVKSIEPGIDIFRRQSDGSWKIMRYMAYSQ